MKYIICHQQECILKCLQNSSHLVLNFLLCLLQSSALCPQKPRNALHLLLEDGGVEITAVETITPQQIFQREIEYKKLPKLAMRTDVLGFWKQHSSRFPNLSWLTRRILCVQACSVACELVFSSTGDIVCQTRASLYPKMLYSPVLLKRNRKL